ncbi:MAG: prolipoprotein diacylglyceryl transferase [Deltaproteobacteria bacterium]|nr:prolipoprotein diacylglyceryl transferase [Deltaproteobacteria bacterium]MBW2537398.1 prolipoprotein diacylglyceryl transferase [Deltaproteobacteria bacterium]
MRSELFRVFDGSDLEVSFPAYFVMLLVGFAFATAIAVIQARRIGENPDVIVDLALASLLMGVVGGRIFHVLFDGYFMDYVHLCTDPSQVDWQISKARCLSERYQGVWDAARGVCHPSEADCWAWAKFWAGGLTYYGGLLAASVTGIYLLRRDRFPVWKGVDLAALGIPLGLGFGRMGCLLAGCCFGQPTEGTLSLTFPSFSPASESQFKAGLLDTAASPSLPVLPAQIYESILSLAVAGICLFWVQGRKRYDGQVMVWFLVLYAVGRFGLEFLRADDRGALLGLSTSQWVGLAVVAFAAWLHRWRLAATTRPA